MGVLEVHTNLGKSDYLVVVSVGRLYYLDTHFIPLDEPAIINTKSYQPTSTR